MQVDFAMAFIGDQLCSSFRILTDLATVICFACTGAYSASFDQAADAPGAACLSSDSGLVIAVLAGSLPFLIRLIQASLEVEGKHTCEAAEARQQSCGRVCAKEVKSAKAKVRSNYLLHPQMQAQSSSEKRSADRKMSCLATRVTVALSGIGLLNDGPDRDRLTEPDISSALT